jgi:hypothetical protein
MLPDIEPFSLCTQISELTQISQGAAKGKSTTPDLSPVPLVLMAGLGR